jgi:TPR repeat protein
VFNLGRERESTNDVNGACQHYENAAKNGNAKAQCRLGDFYKNGIGPKFKDLEHSFKWYEKAANQNNVEAMYNLIVFYENGFGVEKNSKKALEWHEKMEKILSNK